MKFIRLRLPTRGPGAPPFFTRARLRFYLAGLGLLLLSFVVGVYLFFPTEALRERIERDLSRDPVSLAIGDLDLTFPPGLAAEQVTIQTGRTGQRSIEIPSAIVRPLWSSLAGANPGATFRARMLSGEISGWARRNGLLEARASGLVIAEQLASGSALEFAGTVGQGHITGLFPPQAGTESSLELTLDQARINGMQGLGVADGTLALGQITLRGEGRGNNFRISQLEAAGGELQVSGTGSFLFAQPLERSRLNLNLTLRPGTGFDQSLRDLLELFASSGNDGSYRLRISGTLASPIFAK